MYLYAVGEAHFTVKESVQHSLRYVTIFSQAKSLHYNKFRSMKADLVITNH